MEIDQEELLQRTYAIAKENNKLIRKMRRGAWLGFIVKLLLFVVLPMWAYYAFLQPILGQAMGLLGQVQNTAENIGVTPQQLQHLLHTMPGIDTLQQNDQ